MTGIRSTLRPAPFLKGAGRLPFEAMAKAVLGPTYELSLVLCGDRLAQKINKTYRNKSYYPNVLSFELDADNGEIFLNVRKAEREARQLGIPPRKRAALLYVHGLFHLKGMKHSDTMERQEQKILRKFALQSIV
jgi:rRNA maturation RNase YbeY